MLLSTESLRPRLNFQVMTFPEQGLEITLKIYSTEFLMYLHVILLEA